ncbi:17288_t:CDS:2, partial [Dentiscutata heterogama]
SADELVVSSSLKSYLCQKEANSESIHLQDTNMPYKTIEIVEIIGESKVIVDITFESSNTDRCIVQMADIIDWQQLDTVAMAQTWVFGNRPGCLIRDQVKPIPSSKDSYSNIVVFTMPYRGKKDTLYLILTCPVDTSLMLMQSTFTHQNIYKQATAFALSDPNSHIYLLLQKNASTCVIRNYFETCLKNWQEPCIAPCGAELKNMDKKGSINIPKNAFKIDKYTSMETENVKLTRHIDQRLPLILVINVTGISFINEGTYLENKDLLEEINFPSKDISSHGSFLL